MKRRINSFDVTEIEKIRDRRELLSDAIGKPEACSTLVHIAARLALSRAGFGTQGDDYGPDVEKLARDLEWLSHTDSVIEPDYSARVGSAVATLKEWRACAHGLLQNDAAHDLETAIDLIESVARYWANLRPIA